VAPPPAARSTTVQWSSRMFDRNGVESRGPLPNPRLPHLSSAVDIDLNRAARVAATSAVAAIETATAV
jgi:hypothetical protein